MAAHDPRRARRRSIATRRGATAVRARTGSTARAAGVQQRLGQALRGRDGEGRRTALSKGRPWRSSPSRRTRTRSTASSTSRCRKTSTPMFVAQLLHNDEKAVGRILADPNTHISLCDAGAHLTFFCDAGFGLHLMGHWSRDLGVLDLPQAVHRLTGQPARAVRPRRPRPAARGLCRRPDAVRSRRRLRAAPSAAPTTCRPVRRGSPPRRWACTVFGSTAPGSPTTRASAPIPRRGRARSFATSQA